MRADFLAGERRARQRRGMMLGAALVPVAAFAMMLARRDAGEEVVPRAVTAPLTVAAPRADPLPVSSSPPAAANAPATTLKTKPLSAWLSDVARDAARDLVISPELRGDLTATESKELGWRDRLDAYSRVFGFEFAVSDGLIEVRRAAPANRHVDAASSAVAATPATATPAVDGTATASPPAAAGSSSPAQPATPATPATPPQTRVVRLAYATAKDAAAVLAKNGTDVTALADASTNSLVLSGEPKSLSRVLAVVGELDRPRRRIMLEAKIVEVLRSARFDFGVEWKLTGTTVGGDVKFPPPQTNAGSAALVIATHGAAALDAKISALEAGGKLHVISRPSVVMVEGSPATIESVRILRIRLPSNGTVVGDEVSTGSSGRATEDIPVGVRLEVTPAMRGGGRVLLRIKAKSSSLGAPLPPDNIPEELSRMVDAEVLVTSGETAVLGGLSREAGSKSGAGVPGLRRVPGLGALFGRKSDATEDEELLVFVTPHVLD